MVFSDMLRATGYNDSSYAAEDVIFVLEEKYLRSSFFRCFIALDCAEVHHAENHDGSEKKLPLRLHLHFLKFKHKTSFKTQKETSSRLTMTEHASNRPEDEGGQRGPGTGPEFGEYREKPQETASDFSDLTTSKTKKTQWRSRRTKKPTNPALKSKSQTPRSSKRTPRPTWAQAQAT
ncbi:hypothetical protein FPQ18DRAFT_38293 [Pyronema domesticum]|nr:hypothetical protein FPQ18DRAFT_38293 [Pyronema domesticum]